VLKTKNRACRRWPWKDFRMKRDFGEQTRSTALALIGQYGVDAEVIAVMRAAEYAAVGDLEALAAWDEILECLAAIEAGEAGARPIH
jgi:hypothetical protein